MPEEEEGEEEPVDTKTSDTSLLLPLCNAVNNDNIICINVANVLQCSHEIQTLFYMPDTY